MGHNSERGGNKRQTEAVYPHFQRSEHRSAAIPSDIAASETCVTAVQLNDSLDQRIGNVQSEYQL